MNTKTSSWELNDIDLRLIDLAFVEDLGYPYQDITTEQLFLNTKNSSKAKIISKHSDEIIICGLPILKSIIEKIDKDITLQSNYRDGMTLAQGQTLLTLQGSPHHLLMIERILLNFLQRLCAIATLTGKFVKKIAFSKAKILDTRKTIPGFRHLEKYAVFCGGGVNHRFGLYDAIMIKDTHSDFLGGMTNALNQLPDNILEKYPVIVEVRNIDELDIALKHKYKITRVLLDNMKPDRIKTCLTHLRGQLPTESSGNVDLENIQAIAETGVNFISVGKITHSAGNVDLSMKCE